MKKGLNIIGFITAFLMLATVIMKANHFPGATAAMVLAGFGLSIYLPFFLLYRPEEVPDSGRNAAGIVGSVAASLVNLGITFKFMHWPGAGVMLVLGLSTFALAFIPMLLRRKLKEGVSERTTLMNTLGASGLTLFALGILFRIMHWPGASVMLVLSAVFLFFGYFLMYMTDKTIGLETKTRYLRGAFMAVILGCVVTSLILVSLNKPWHAQPKQEVAQNR